MSYFLIFDTLTYLTVAGQLIAALLLTSLLFSYKSVTEWVRNHALLLMFVVALIATSGSLFFSEVALFAPCKDCWFQRIFMYPQVILLGIALWKKDRNVVWYILALSLIGGGLSIDHYHEQWEAMLQPENPDAIAPCDLSGISCSATYLFELGYITIPLMAGTAFLLNILGSLTVLLKRK